MFIMMANLFSSAKSGHKIDAIRACDKVSFCVIFKDDVIKEKLTTAYESAIVFGRARIRPRSRKLWRQLSAFLLSTMKMRNLQTGKLKTIGTVFAVWKLKLII